ncbi:GspH/FimT family pseudopilin [Paraburkholderia piptadeniae]|nr:GspH/FimT family pseudopilin [Paraburkholderia piptadeniae]
MKRDAHSWRVCRGFTLFETLVVIALLVIVTTMSVPSFVAWHMRDQVDARARVLLFTLSYARGEALRRGVRVTVCRVDSARHCLAVGQACKTGAVDWSCGWAVMIEHPGGFYPLRVQPDLTDVSIAGALTNLTFTRKRGKPFVHVRSHGGCRARRLQVDLTLVALSLNLLYANNQAWSDNHDTRAQSPPEGPARVGVAGQGVLG